jgi:hypothetical protein
MKKLRRFEFVALDLNSLSNRKMLLFCAKIKTEKTIKSLSSHPKKGMKKGKRFVFFL